MQRMPEGTAGQTSVLSPPHVLEPVTVEKCALTFILDFEAHSLSAHCVVALVGEEAAPEVCLHINECLQILDVHVEGTDLRLDFILDKYFPTGFAALEGSQMMRVLVPQEAWQSGEFYSIRLQVKYRVLPGSTALIWMDGSDDDDAQMAMTQDQPGWASALFPCQGYDMLLAARDNVKRLWLHHPLFLETLVDPNQQAHHLSVIQSCVDSEEMFLALSSLVGTLSKTNCAAGDVAMNIAIAQACLVQRQWARALELYLLSFALLVAAPWDDCIDQQVWDVSAEDVLYNVARIVGLVAGGDDDALLAPAEAVSRLAWRPAPRPQFANRLLPWSRRQCRGPRTLSGACLGFGKIHVQPQDFEGAAAALCSEFGAFHSAEWINVLDPEEQFPIGRGTSGELFIVPVGTPYPNLWHALHWWVPALVHKQEQGWDPSKIHVGVVFDSRPRNGQRWEVEMPGSDTERFAAFHGVILRLLSSNPVRFVAHEGNMSCFAEASVGFRSFRYDLVTPQVTRQDVEVFRRALQTAVGMDRRPLNTESGSFPRVLIIQREKGQPRYIVNLGHMLRVLRRSHGFVTDWQQLEKHALLEQFSLVAQTNILVGAHGAGLAWMVAMETGSAVVELMPGNLPRFVMCMESWDHLRNQRHSIYGGLAMLAGQHHVCVRGNTSLADHEVRNFREELIYLPLPSVAQAILQAVAIVRQKSIVKILTRNGMDEQAIRSSYLLRLWVPENMLAIAAGGRLEKEPPVRMNGHLEYAYCFDWKMPARSLTFIAGSFGQISGRFSTFFGLTPPGSIQKAAEEIEDSLQPFHDALMHMFKDDDKAGPAGGPVLQLARQRDDYLPTCSKKRCEHRFQYHAVDSRHPQVPNMDLSERQFLNVVLLPAHVCPQGGRGVLRLLILPMYMLSAGKVMWYALELCLVKAWLGISDCALSWRDRWLCSGLELYVLQHLMRDAHGDAASMLHLSFLWRGFCRAAQQLPEHGAESRPRCAARTWEKRLGELQELVGGDLAMYLWLGQSLPPEENEALVRRLRRKCREAPISEEVALAAVKAHSELPMSLTEWPPDDWCAEQLRKQLRAASSLAEVREVEKVASAWEDIIPVEVVGGSENKLNKLIIRTAIHVKVKWTVLQQLFFLDLLQDSTSVYRDSVVHIGNAYGFNASSNVDVLRRWCMILIKHNCQDHVGVLETCLELQREVAHFSSIFAAMVERAQSVTRLCMIGENCRKYGHERWCFGGWGIEPRLQFDVQIKTYVTGSCAAVCVVLPQHVHAGEPEHLEKQWQEAVAPVLTEQHTIAGDLALRVGSLESEVNVAIAARLEKLEKEVFAVSCRLQVHQLDFDAKGPTSMIGVIEADPKRAIERLDSKLDGAVHQLIEQVQQLRSVTSERFRETEQKIADCEAALTGVCAPHAGREVGREADGLVQSELQDFRPIGAALAKTTSSRSPGRLDPAGALRNASPAARPLCRRRGWASGAFRTGPASPSVQPVQTESVDFFVPRAAAAVLPDANIQELVDRVSEMQREAVPNFAGVWDVSDRIARDLGAEASPIDTDDMDAW
eukprot:s1967_g6.t4